MLFNAKTLKGFTLLARDGEIGKVKDLYFDDYDWTVRYLVLDTGGWLTGRKVLISPRSLEGIDHSGEHIRTGLTRTQVEESPGIETDQPITREFETTLHGYYAWPYYWTEPVYSATGYLGPLAGTVLPPDGIGRQRTAEVESRAATLEEADSHLQSVQEVMGWPIQANDGAIGHVEDFLLSPADWRIRQIVIDTRNWWPGRKVLVAPGWISNVDWMAHEVAVALDRESIKHSPEYDPKQPVSEDYESALQRHYYDRYRPM